MTADARSSLQRGVRRVAIAVGALAAAIVVVAGGIYGAVQYDGNFHAVDPGVVYRSAQLSGKRLDEVVHRYGIRSVLNLRGDNTGKAWYDGEMRTVRTDGLVHLDVSLSAYRELTPAQMRGLLKMIADAPKPVLIHCNAGSDRTGLVAAIYELSRGVPPAEAGEQLSLRYGHFPWLGSRSVAMDRSLAAWIAAAPASDASPAATVGVPPSLKEVARIAIGGEARWDYLAVDGPRHRLYVSHATITEVVDTQTDKLVGTIPDTAGVHGIAIAADLGLGFVSDGKADAVTVFELATLKTRATIKVGANPDAILYDPATHRVLTFNGKSHDVSVIDAAQGKVVATVPAGGKPEFAQLGEAGLVWFNVEDTGELAVLDPVAARVVRRVSLAPCDSPSGLAVDDRHRLYAVCENRQMVVVAPDGKVLGRPTIGTGPDGVAWLDGAAYSANGQDGTISVVRETSPGRFETVETIASEPGARTLAADAATRRLYLPTAALRPAQAGQRRAGIAGSFHVRVLEKQD